MDILVNWLLLFLVYMLSLCVLCVCVLQRKGVGAKYRKICNIKNRIDVKWIIYNKLLYSTSSHRERGEQIVARRRTLAPHIYIYPFQIFRIWIVRGKACSHACFSRTLQFVSQHYLQPTASGRIWKLSSPYIVIIRKKNTNLLIYRLKSGIIFRFWFIKLNQKDKTIHQTKRILALLSCVYGWAKSEKKIDS